MTGRVLYTKIGQEMSHLWKSVAFDHQVSPGLYHQSITVKLPSPTLGHVGTSKCFPGFSIMQDIPTVLDDTLGALLVGATIAFAYVSQLVPSKGCRVEVTFQYIWRQLCPMYRIFSTDIICLENKICRPYILSLIFAIQANSFRRS